MEDDASRVNEIRALPTVGLVGKARIQTSIDPKLGDVLMNELADSGLKRSFNTVFALFLMVFGSCFAGARTVSSGVTDQQSGALTYSGNVLHTFDNSPDGASPLVGLVADSSGNLYGTTLNGGAYGIGAVFELTPDGNGGWTYDEIYSAFGGTGLAIDSQGNLYLTINIAPGAVIELSPSGPNGTWVESRGYGFTGGPDGSLPQAPVILDADGNVYGTTLNGADGCGTVFRLIPYGNQWGEETLHTFSCNDPDGEYPNGSLILDRAGNLYGTASLGGTGYAGIVFKLHLTSAGWKEKVLYNFQGGANDGFSPTGNLIFDHEGNLYGVTKWGFGTPTTRGTGGVYKLAPSGQITWLYVFGQIPDLDGGPGNGLVFDQAGNLYGTASGGAPSQYTQYCPSGCGEVYELTPSNDNGTTTWTGNVLYSFTSGSDGFLSGAVPLFDHAGNIYITSYAGGVSFGYTGFGTVFELKPNPIATTTTITSNTPNPSKTGQVVTFGFAVSPSVKTNTKPTGTVTINASSGESCLVPLRASGKGSCQLMFLTAGSRTLTATYSGDTRDQGSTSEAVTIAVMNLTKTVITRNDPDPSVSVRL